MQLFAEAADVKGRCQASTEGEVRSSTERDEEDFRGEVPQERLTVAAALRRAQTCSSEGTDAGARARIGDQGNG